MCWKFGENALYQICTTKCKNQTRPFQIHFLNGTGNYQNFLEAKVHQWTQSSEILSSAWYGSILAKLRWSQRGLLFSWLPSLTQTHQLCYPSLVPVKLASHLQKQVWILLSLSAPVLSLEHTGDFELSYYICILFLLLFFFPPFIWDSRLIWVCGSRLDFDFVSFLTWLYHTEKKASISCLNILLLISLKQTSQYA